jgi:hypothetical protein
VIGWRTAARLLAGTIVLSVAAAILAAATQAPREPIGPARLCGPGRAQLSGPPTATGRPAYVACVPVLSQRSGTSRLDLRYSTAVSRATSSSALAVCWSERDWTQIDAVTKRALGDGIAATGGFVWDGQQVANLPPRLCRNLDRTVHDGQRRSVDRWTAWAFKNLTHEALHVAGVDDEAVTECYALQQMAQTIEALGLNRSYAERLAALGWSRYKRLARVQPLYFSIDCRNGGPLDLAPWSSRWPTA